MIVFTLCTVLLSAFAITLLLKPLLVTPDKEQTVDENNTNALLYQKRKQELDNELENNNIDAAQHEENLNSYQTQLYLDNKTHETDSVQSSRNFKKTTSIILILSVPIIAFVIYLSLGGGMNTLQGNIPTVENTQQDQEQLLTTFIQKLETQGSSASEWQLLGQIYQKRNEFSLAEKAFFQARQLEPENASITADYIELSMLLTDGKPNDETTALLKQTLTNNNEEPKLLWLAAMHASYENNTELQITYLKQLLALIPQDSPQRQIIEKIILATEDITTVNDVVLTIKVNIDDTIKPHIKEGATLFVYARAMQGPRMPLAVARYALDATPETIVLNDQMAMMPEMKLSDFEEVEIIALISHSGQAQTSPGDLRGNVMNIKPNTQELINVTIDELIETNNQY